MVDSIKKDAVVAQIFQEFYDLTSDNLEGIFVRALKDVYTVLCEKISMSEDWLANDFSMAANTLESNQQWLAHHVTGSALKKVETKSAPDRQGGDHETPVMSASIDDLVLVSNDDLEDALVVSTAVNSIENALSYELLDLCQFYSALLKFKFDKEAMPISPYSLMNDVKYGVDKLQLPTSTQAITYKVMAKALSVELKELYVQLLLIPKKRGFNYKPVEPSKKKVAPKTPKPLSSVSSEEEFDIPVLDSEVAEDA